MIVEACNYALEYIHFEGTKNCFHKLTSYFFVTVRAQVSDCLTLRINNSTFNFGQGVYNASLLLAK